MVCKFHKFDLRSYFLLYVTNISSVWANIAIKRKIHLERVFPNMDEVIDEDAKGDLLDIVISSFKHSESFFFPFETGLELV